jgi:isoleucyl-tRNA synthetase
MNCIKAEEEVLEFWNKDNSFYKSNQNKSNTFTFFEGPPFATGLPHYGHILAGFIKDTICRSACQNGYSVQRNATWDTHGLPIEYEIEKSHGIRSKQQILDYGIGNYNKACESIVLKYSNEWENIIGRLGRWINWKSNIKTMDFDYMNCVWNIFSKIYTKGLIYEDFKVMPYSNACTTPLSNFEASSNYQNVTDKTVVVKFKLFDETNKYFLVWTTTPWTLPMNQALCVNPNLDYVYVTCLEDNVEYILCKNLVDPIFKKKKYTITKNISGSELVGMQYYSLFDTTLKSVFGDTYVNESSGTGIVHLAPGFGEDDFKVCRNNGFKASDIYIPINESGVFNLDVKPVSIQGVSIKDSIKPIIKQLKEQDLIFDTFEYTHSYPYCWRSDTPLIYKAVSSWFLKVTDIKDKLIESNSKTNWVPQNIRDGRFHNWLSDAKDWCLSRNRYWGTPIPIWKSECGKVIVVSSASELEQLAGLVQGSITNLHRDYIDHIIIEKDLIKYTRCEYVLDCWFESGSIPFVINPFDPCADFIAEGLDQTRGWFYTLLVISTALSNQIELDNKLDDLVTKLAIPFKNVIVNGLVLASDGKKMSKRLQNYPDPMEVVNKYGSDALRVYLITSVASRAESIKFNENEVRSIMQNIILPLTNSFAFYFEYETKAKLSGHEIKLVESSNPLDHWIINQTEIFILKLKNCYFSYTLQPILNLLLDYINILNNEYLRLNREHLKTSIVTLGVFKYVLEIVILHLAPVLPFLTEYFNLKLGSSTSIHCKEFASIKTNIKWINSQYVTQSDYLMKIIAMIRSLRGNLQRKKPIKYAIIKALPEMFTVLNTETMKQFIASETNIIDLDIELYVPTVKIYTIKPNFKVLGAKSKLVQTIIKTLSQENINKLLLDGLIELGSQTIELNEVIIDEHIPESNGLISESNDKLQLSVSVNLTQDEQTEKIYVGKVLAREFQQLRKECGLHPWDPVELAYISSYELEESILNIIAKSTVHVPLKISSVPEKNIGSKKIEILDIEYYIFLI